MSAVSKDADHGLPPFPGTQDRPNRFLQPFLRCSRWQMRPFRECACLSCVLISYNARNFVDNLSNEFIALYIRPRKTTRNLRVFRAIYGFSFFFHSHFIDPGCFADALALSVDRPSGDISRCSSRWSRARQPGTFAHIAMSPGGISGRAPSRVSGRAMPHNV